MTQCSNPECGRDIKDGEGRVCVYCGRVFCPDCVVAKVRFRQEDYFCKRCFETIEKKVTGRTEPRDVEIKAQLATVSDLKGAKKPGRLAECSACGTKLTFFDNGRICSICGKAFCADCMQFGGEFRKSDNFCRKCVDRLLKSVVLTPESSIPGYEIDEVLDPLSSLKFRSPVLTEFFLKWQAFLSGANAILAYRTNPSLDGVNLIGAGSAVVVRRRPAE